MEPLIPEPTGACPKLQGEDTLTFDPAGVERPRDADVWAGGGGGPLVMFWHDVGGTPADAAQVLGTAFIESVTAQGGLVVAPHADEGAGTWTWFLATTGRDDDLVVADEIVACAAADYGVDPERIHSVGFGAGGLHTAQLSLLRAGYVASVATISGGIVGALAPVDADPNNRFAAMVVHGGDNDGADLDIDLRATSEQYWYLLTLGGRFAVLCDHGGGHVARPKGTARFLEDHPYGRAPSPYENRLPGTMPDYCQGPR